MELLPISADGSSLFWEGRWERTWVERREVVLHHYGLDPPEKDVGGKYLGLKILLHRAQIHTQKRKPSCPTNLLKENLCSPLPQESSPGRRLAETSTISNAQFIQESLSSWERWEWGTHPCKQCFLLLCSKKHLSLGGEQKGAGLYSVL